MNAVQTLKLDARQRAMLDEMGVKVWWPMPEVVEETPVAIETVAAVEEQAPVSERFVAEAPAPVPAPVARSAPAPAPVSGPAPAAPAVPATHGAAVLIEAPRRLYGDAVDPLASVEGGWLVVADMPP
jgi:hypothetical protein